VKVLAARTVAVSLMLTIVVDYPFIVHILNGVRDVWLTAAMWVLAIGTDIAALAVLGIIAVAVGTGIAYSRSFRP
jgi:hypothetical protein